MKMPASFNRYIKRQIQTVLAAHADALLLGTVDREKLLAPYDNVIREQAESLMMLAERIQASVTDGVPSEKFVAQLRFDLLEQAAMDPDTWVDWLRNLPARTQWAAGIGGATLTAGVVLLASRSTLEFWRNRRTGGPFDA